MIQGLLETFFDGYQKILSPIGIRPATRRRTLNDRIRSRERRIAITQACGSAGDRSTALWPSRAIVFKAK
jgi:hypothetical protein